MTHAPGTPGRAVHVPYTGAMRRLDTRDNPAIGVLDEMLREISTMTEPVEIMAAYGSRYARLYPSDVVVTVSRRGLEPGEYKITRLINNTLDRDTAMKAGEYPNPWRDWDTLATHTGGFIGGLIDAGVPQVITNLEWRDDPALGDACAEMGSCLAIPAYDGGESLNWLVRFRRDPEGFSLKELERELLTTNLFGNATKTRVTSQQFAELNTRLRGQLDEVARVQQSLLPHNSPEIPGLSLATSYLTSEQAGGDYFDFYRFDRGRWGVLIADVSGHGPAAATVMAMLQSIVASYSSLHPDDPGGMILHLNQRLCDSLNSGMFVTGFFMVYDPKTGRVSYARCGHNPPRLHKRDGAGIAPMDQGGAFPLGIDPDLSLCEGEAFIDPGDTVVLYTDGITEQFNTDGEMFGVPRLDSAIARTDGAPDAVVASIHDGLFDFTGQRTRDDDQTLVVLRRDA